MRITMLPLAFYPSKAYFNLVDSVDHCVFVADGKYAARRVNRTRLADNSWLTLPVASPGRNQVPFHEATIWWDDDGKWHDDMMTRIAVLYDSEYLESNDVFKDMKKLPEYGSNLCHTLREMTRGVMKYMNIQTRTSLASELSSAALCGQRRAIQVCKSLGATEFLQPEWAKRFFDRVAFRRQGITLSFYEADSEEEMDVSILDTCFGWWND